MREVGTDGDLRIVADDATQEYFVLDPCSDPNYETGLGILCDVAFRTEKLPVGITDESLLLVLIDRVERGSMARAEALFYLRNALGILKGTNP